MPGLTLDLLLAAALLGIAWRALTSRDLFRATVLFIVFGLLMALAWIRLGAPDIALAEAAIGAGITGALLLDAVAQIGAEDRSARPPRLVAGAAALLCGGIALAVGAAALQLPQQVSGLAPVVFGALQDGGIAQPVTAVLLNFRGYDTWLELGVLLLAVLALLALRGTADLRDAVPSGGADPLLSSLAALLVPILILTSGYLLWLGTHGSGGAFQAGAMLGGAGVLLHMADHRSVNAAGTRLLRIAVLSGFAAFLLTAVASIACGRALLEYPPEHAYLLIVLIEAAAAVGIGSTLAALFIGAAPRRP